MHGFVANEQDLSELKKCEIKWCKVNSFTEGIGGKMMIKTGKVLAEFV